MHLSVPSKAQCFLEAGKDQGWMIIVMHENCLSRPHNKNPEQQKEGSNSE